MEKMLSLSLIFLDSPKILLCMSLFYNVLCVVFEALDGCGNGLEMSVYPVQNIKFTLESNRINSEKAFCIVPDSHTYHYASYDIH